MAPYTESTLPLEIIAGLPPNLQAQVPHYDETMQPNIYAACIISIVAAYIAVSLRLWGRRLRSQNLWWDDYLCLVALFLVSVFTAIALYVTVLGLGRWTIKVAVEHPENLLPFAKATISGSVIYSPALLASKLSLLFLFYRIFPSKRYKWTLIVVGIFVISYSIVALLVNLLHCMPIERNWDNTIKGYCFNLGVEPVLLAVFNVITDFVIFVLPLPYIWRLNTSFRAKLQLSSILALGSFVIVVAIIRSVQVSGLGYTDGFWDNGPDVLWSDVEVCMAVVAACLPVLRPVFNKLVYGDHNAPAKEAEFSRNVVTIGGSEIPMNKLGSKTQAGETNASKSTTNTTKTTSSGPGGDAGISTVGLIDRQDMASTKSMVERED
ncbi:hypothetical protein EKO27_g8352 [Xylaria grammica]|uniref:Rhodopsin domain-containing protein n=1 Tax=Xylaria grammica TaxID=363999 RepID=A0A439CX94_9PEZI|nr:hypothetical protein EKO27_g8352 [Xylaria grammica]